MNRRQLFPSLLAAAITAPALVAQSILEPKPASPESELWVEIDCQGQFPDYYIGNITVMKSCGTRFRFLRGNCAVCPKCGITQNLWTSEELRKMTFGIEVKS